MSKSRTRTGNGHKGQPQVGDLLDGSVEVAYWTIVDKTVSILFKTVEDAKSFGNALEVHLAVEQELKDYEEDPMDGVLRTLKAEKPSGKTKKRNTRKA